MNETSRDSSDQRAQQVGLLVADVVEAAGAIQKLGNEIAGAVGQTLARWSALSAFASEGDWTVSRAARRLGITRQSLQRVVDLLLEEGLLVAEPNPDHARSPLIRLTAEGERTFGVITAAAEPWQALAAEGLDAEDLLAARRVLHQVTEAARSYER